MNTHIPIFSLSNPCPMKTKLEQRQQWELLTNSGREKTEEQVKCFSLTVSKHRQGDEQKHPVCPRSTGLTEILNGSTKWTTRGTSWGKCTSCFYSGTCMSTGVRGRWGEDMCSLYCPFPWPRLQRQAVRMSRANRTLSKQAQFRNTKEH